MLTKKDKSTITKKINSALINYDRILLQDATPAMIKHLQEVELGVDATFEFLSNNDDISHAALIRNSGKKAVFVFSDTFPPTSYFTETSSKVTLSKALLNRSL
jgi:hypothetical protein